MAAIDCMGRKSGSPILFAVLGTVLITGVCLLTPMLNDYFKDVESSATTIGKKEQPLLEGGTSQPNLLSQEEPAN
ncbi:MAG: hypothetical protein JKX71_07465 [Amylibacter sp.]|nr:hypothetical protein [Amylibacter sp.]